MASLQTKTDAVKETVASTATCTAATVVALKGLLLTEIESTGPGSKQIARPSTKAKSVGASKKTPSDSRHQQLSAKEKIALATFVINSTLKSLTEAAKPAPPSTPCKRDENLQQSTGRRALRRSMSTPLSPLQPRTLNRVATSPNVLANKKKTSSASLSTGCLSTVECARVAFACLRSLKTSIQDGDFDLQLENGTSALIGKLLALGLHEQALKEMRILKLRLSELATADTSRP
jgi:separase